MSSWFELAVMFKNNRSSDYKKETTWLLFLFEENVVQPTLRKKLTLDLNLGFKCGLCDLTVPRDFYRANLRKQGVLQYFLTTCLMVLDV
jgi:hypothetical protein